MSKISYSLIELYVILLIGVKYLIDMSGNFLLIVYGKRF